MDIGNHKGFFVFGAEILVHDANVAATVVMLDEEIVDTTSTLDKRILSSVGAGLESFLLSFHAIKPGLLAITVRLIGHVN